MSVWIQSLFSALLPLPPQINVTKKWKIMNGCAFFWSEAQSLKSRHTVPNKTSAFVTGEEEGWLFLTAPLCQGFTFPGRAGTGRQRQGLTCRAGAEPRPLHLWQGSGMQLLPAVPAASLCRRGWSPPSIPPAQPLLGNFISGGQTSVCIPS